ncbi:MAG: serine/threonine protein phosphatase [Novosphingobium sp. 17-62-19]|uniref:metallophosphoesterase family protein n=1 Tax=Novosphingobium sp. 17-62-19 TaxID=1970406 RepID=UPI000BD61C52|nr:metallophosphoesterase family protein [Novosphingobium sp. 17-62-19]OZA21048.1 MAG: serine/threonine protein phosphatase [Novosphingobium sp. 17-62-19]HQS96670.1 metallophosphoesterase family protein [Novosphingobium sp.]
MLSKLRSLFSSSGDAPEAIAMPVARVPQGQRVYAVGDIHGRLDLFEQLLQRIEADDAARRPADTTLILLGDLIDRGPDSRAMVDRAMELAQSGNVRVLAGNHEEMLLVSMENDEALRHFLRHGGKETLFSYGLDPAEYSRSTLPDLRERMAALVPGEHIAFFHAMEDRIVIGDYLFVHAGIRPGVPIEEQATSDLRWIRREFLDHADWHGHLVVHGHTITDAPDVQPNRIGIDTGAYASGRLTALGIEGGENWFISAEIIPAEPAEV